MLVKEGDRALLGSKGLELYRCSLLGVNVPEFWILTTECFSKSYGKVIDDDILRSLQVVFEDLGGRVAVRSSSVAEDLSNSSNAGMFRTILNVDSFDDMIKSIGGVWASSNGNDMAVIIQKQIDPDIAGVLFTRDPLEGSNETIIEYVDGLGSRLVSGRSDPIRIKVGNNDSSGLEQDPDQVKTVDLSPLIKTSRFLENKFGYPLDIEWAYSMSEFHILQVRPITNLPPPKRNGFRTYSRVQAEQFYSGPVTPLFYSIFKKIFTEYYLKEAIDTLGLRIEVDSEYMIRHRNFLYVDTRIVEYALSTIPDKMEIMDFLEVLPPDNREDLKEDKNVSLFSILARVLTFILFHRKLWISKLDSTYKNEIVPEILSQLNSFKVLRTLNDDQIIDHYHRLMEVMKLHVGISKWGLSLYSIPLMGAMDHLLKRNDLAVYLPDLISGFTENRTMEASREIHHLATMAKNNKRILNVLASDLGDHSEYLSRIKRTPNGDRFVEYFENVILMYGHRRISRDIYYPSWRDDANIPFSILRKIALSSGDQDFDRNLEQIRCKRITAIGIVRSSLSRSEKFLFSIIYKHLLRYVEFRELQRFYLDMILAKFRELVLEISSRMVDRDRLDHLEDIFFLDIGSVWRILAGSRWREIKTEAKFNKVSFENESGIPGRYLRRGTSFDDVKNIRRETYHRNGRIIAGQPVSSGVHEGKIIVMKDLNIDSQIDKGDILVTKYIDPGQTHLFLLAGALVLEVGGLLSHGAILAREFNIPTVAGVKNATKLLKDEQRAQVNGFLGTVTILNERVQ